MQSYERRFSCSRRYTRLMLKPKRRLSPPLITSLALLLLLCAPQTAAQQGAGGDDAAPASEGSAGAVEGAPFAGLTIKPAGRQLFDVTTGITNLPDGGSITDRATGVTVTAAEIEYLPGDYVTAAGVNVTGEFGQVEAGELRIDLKAGTLAVEGPLKLTREGLSVTAGSLTFDAGAGIAIFEAGVTGSGPDFRTDRLLLDTRTGDALLSGEYEYHDTLFVMESPLGGGLLELRFAPRDGEPAYEVATEVSEALLARLKDHL